jgi:hypothetical protein
MQVASFWLLVVESRTAGRNPESEANRDWLLVINEE